MEKEIELRDYFAAHCPQEMTECVTWGEIRSFKKLKEGTSIEAWRPEYTLEWRCAKRYEYADAMLKAREVK